MRQCPFCAEEIQDEAQVCKHCKRELVVRGQGFQLGRVLGLLVFLAGLGGMLFAVNMDTTVEVPMQYVNGIEGGIGGGRVNNIGLMNDKNNYMTGSGVAIVAGILLIGLAGRNK